ncbi:hypothetical protein [Streptomyces acidiscabies]|uniref:Uncharacterized protein n=1 Tax=Streptomyces acidiscabies TaxID=42234 RepID=A0AAP6BJY0_9ACTN|nr:hypothetical protein [Streptomyces acidiscabies]MBZ3914698.1 hypothetical protein [Streptomyces acidiscabies]MDX2966149.1 hypothetical protein [Streptomyces acidiscabies]MDX3020612.1 hypothetical protein [Streptomyces acidiscabies]MDX3795819.1 hypothetical protein [Streptomyces acidiscabies]
MTWDAKDMTMRKLATTAFLSLLLTAPTATATAATHAEAKSYSVPTTRTALPSGTAHRSTHHAWDPDADANPATGGSDGSWGSGYAAGIGAGTGGGELGGAGGGGGSGSGSGSGGIY